MRVTHRPRLAFLTVFALAACAPGGSDLSGTGGNGTGTGGTNATGSGGATSGTGGADSGSGGSTSGSGGATSGTGGATSGTGGADSGSGGSTSGSGGASSGTGGDGMGGSATTGSGGMTTGGTSGSGGRTGGGGRAGATGGAGGAATGGATGTGGTGTGGASTGSGGASTGSGGAGGATSQHFSFFVVSVGAIRTLSKSNDGFGGDLRYGQSTGLAGADKICTEVAEGSLPGSGAKGWRAFLSTTKGGTNDGPVHAIDRIGEGPWYDRMGRIVAMDKTALLNTRPQGADPTIINDLPNELGIPNHQDGAPGCSGNACPDNHDILTGTGTDGHVYGSDWSTTCHDWMSAVAGDGKPRCGHCWPRGTQSWISVLNEAGCAPGINLEEMGGPNPNNPTVGSGGGYGGFYCFALAP